MGPTLLEARVGAAVDRDVGAGDEAGLLGAQEGDDRPEVAGVAQEPDRHAGRRTRRVAAVEGPDPVCVVAPRSEEHTSELQSLMRISYAVFCLKKKKTTLNQQPALIYTSTRLAHKSHN